MPDTPYDLFVIGGGSGGVRAARTAAASGARVGLAEERDLGGTCVNRGCIPKKLLVYAAQVADELEDALGFGWSSNQTRFSWPTLIANKDREIHRLNGIYRSLLEDSGVKVFAARASLADRTTVDVRGEALHAEHILLATGGHPFRPPFPGDELAITSDDAFHLEELPRRVVIVGGGYVAAEFAAIFDGLGSAVTILYRGALPLRGFDREMRKALMAAMEARGIDVRCNAEVDRLEGPSPLRVHVKEGGCQTADAVLLATGRPPNTAGLGLEEVGVELDRHGAVKVDVHCRTSVENIFAIGDCNNRFPRADLTPVAIAEAMVVVETILQGEAEPLDYEGLPTAVFSQPCLASVGLTEEEAKGRLGDVDVYTSSFRPLKNTLSDRDERSLVKLVVDPGTDRVAGAHMLGPDAAEIIQGLAVALQAGATKAQFDATLAIHPTSAEEFVTLRTRRSA